MDFRSGRTVRWRAGSKWRLWCQFGIVERFSADVAAWLEWRSGLNLPAVLEERGEDVLDLWKCVREKLEDFFLRCSLAAFDARAVTLMNSTEQDLQALAAGNLSSAGEAIASLPLSEVTSDQVLDLRKGINPSWQGVMARFCDEIVLALLGEREKLTRTDWELIKSSFSHYEDWLAQNITTPVATLGVERAEEWQRDGIQARIMALIEQDSALQPEVEAMVEVERLIRYCGNLYSLVNNFVSFRDFYTGRGKAIFQAGTLYLDGRSFDLCVRVADISKHATLAVLSRVFLLYCDCVRDGGSQRMTIAAAITNGDCDQLIVGRNGVFYDRQGLDWDATVVRVLEHPISMRQSFLLPYKQLGRAVSEQIQKLSAARSKAAEEKRLATLMQVGAKKEDPKQSQQQAFDMAKYAGIFAAVGLAVGAIGTAVATVVSSFFKLAWWQMPLAVLGILLAVSGPSVLIAWFKLRQRNLGPILDANGWAVNARAKLNIPFGASLTALAKLPSGASQHMSDPYAEKRTPWRLYLFLLAVGAIAAAVWYLGLLR
jgi:hypothetical protein